MGNKVTKQDHLAESSSKELLLIAAKKVFARKGFGAATIRDIANEANINSSMISYYFAGKNGLYTACLQEIGEQHLSFAKKILTPPTNKEELKVRMSLFIEDLFTLFTKDRDSGIILIREYDRLNSPAGSVFQGVFLELFQTLKNFFASSQKQKLISKEHDPMVLAFLFFGSITSQLRLDHIKEKAFSRTLKTEKEKKKTFNSIIQLFLNS